MIQAVLILLLTVLAGKKLNQKLFGNPQSPEANGAHPILMEIPTGFLTGWLIYCTTGYAATVLSGSTLTGTITGLAVCAGLTFLPSKKVSPSGKPLSGPETLTLAIGIAAAGLLDFCSLMDTSDQLIVSRNVYSDFTFHLALTRSFSQGDNFPTEFPFFPGEGMPYHFLHHFGCSTLETLGSSLVGALNFPAAAGLIAMLCLIHCLAVRITGQKWAGPLATLLALIPPTLPTALWEAIKTEKPFHALLAATEYPETYTVDVWGIWIANNIFSNQRHLPFGIAILCWALLLFVPNLKGTPEKAETLLQRLKKTLWSKSAWIPEGTLSTKQALCFGVLLGMSGLYNGATLMATLIALATLGVFSYGRIAFAAAGITAAAIAVLQNKIFCPADGIANISWAPGFLAVNKPTLENIIKCLWVSTGATLPLLAVTLLIASKAERKSWAIPSLVFLAPLAFAFLFQASPAMPANHKFVLISTLLCLIPTTGLIARALAEKKTRGLGATLLLLALLPAAGYLPITIKKASGFTRISTQEAEWIENITPPQAVFLTGAEIVTDPVLTAGRKTYAAGPYFSLSSGFKFTNRVSKIDRILGQENIQSIAKELSALGITHILVSESFRKSFPNANAGIWEEKSSDNPFKKIGEVAGLEQKPRVILSITNSWSQN